jgi:hypothetical protein
VLRRIYQRGAALASGAARHVQGRTARSERMERHGQAAFSAGNALAPVKSDARSATDAVAGRHADMRRGAPSVAVLVASLGMACVLSQTCRGAEPADAPPSAGTVLRFVPPRAAPPKPPSQETPASKSALPVRSLSTAAPSPLDWTTDNFRAAQRSAVQPVPRSAIGATAPRESGSIRGSFSRSLIPLPEGQLPPALAMPETVEPAAPPPGKRGILSWLPWIGGDRQTQRR